jgi:hypothetical protein
VSSVLNPLIEKGRVCADHGEAYDSSAIFQTTIVAEIVTEGGGSAGVVGIEEAETIDYTALQAVEVKFLISAA